MPVSKETMESLAIAVLKGDVQAALALSDLVQQEWSEEGVRLPPVTRLNVDVGRLRVVALFDAVSCGGIEAAIDVPAVEEDIRRWLHDGEPLLMFGARSVTLYELPEQSPSTRIDDVADRALGDDGIRLVNDAARERLLAAADPRVRTAVSLETRHRLAPGRSLNVPPDVLTNVARGYIRRTTSNGADYTHLLADGESMDLAGRRVERRGDEFLVGETP